MFLQPRISKHPLYPEVKDALLADKSKQFLVGSCPHDTSHPSHMVGQQCWHPFLGRRLHYNLALERNNAAASPALLSCRTWAAVLGKIQGS